MESNKYDFALSFAGEEREYVEAVAKILKARGVSVFYDRDEEVELWGKDLAEHFHYIYSRAATFCVIFVSSNYIQKAWPRHERRSALERAISSRGEYILPARFDNSELPGVSSSMGYIDISGSTPEEFAEKLIRKLRGSPEGAERGAPAGESSPSQTSAAKIQSI